MLDALNLAKSQSSVLILMKLEETYHRQQQNDNAPVQNDACLVGRRRQALQEYFEPSQPNTNHCQSRNTTVLRTLNSCRSMLDVSCQRGIVSLRKAHVF